MDMKEIPNTKSMMQNNSIKRLIYFINNLEEKLSSAKIIHNKLNELMFILSKSHQTIVEEIITIKTVLNQTNIEQFQEEDEIIPIDETKSEWEEDDDDDEEEEEIQSTKQIRNIHRRNSPSVRRNDRLVLNSASSYNSSSTIENRSNSSTSKRSSNLKKSDQPLSRVRSPKSVTFSLDENIQNQPLTLEKKSEIIIPVIPPASSELLTEEKIPKIGNIITNIRIHEIEPKTGEYLRLLNISNSDDYDLSGHFLQQNIYSKVSCRFRFPSNTIIRAGQTLTIWCGSSTDISPQPPYVFVWKEQRKWETGPQCLTILAKPDGQAIAWFRILNKLNIDESSSDILFLHSKSNAGASDTSCLPSSINNRQSRLSTFNLSGNNKPPFAHSPNSPIHPDHNGTSTNLPHDLRSQMHQKSGFSQLLNRPKSSPFASHTGCKQDLISRNFLRNQQTQGHKQTTVKT